MTDIDTALESLTIEERIALTVGSGRWTTVAYPERGVRELWLSDGPHGLRRETAPDVSVPSTCFPTASALGATWDRELVQRVGRALGREAAALNVDVLLGPGINMKRTPLCGRNFEYPSEDPLLTGELAIAYIRGVQGMGVAACLKHFAANNQEQWRHSISAQIDQRTLHETYLRAFERVIEHAEPWTVMCAYNRLNGTYTAEHRGLLTEILRDQWGFSGLVVSDWDAVTDPVASIAAGLDLIMPVKDGATEALLAAVSNGALAQEAVDQAARRLLALADRTTSRGPATPLTDEELRAHHELAREVGRASIVLLHNDSGVLPLSPQTTSIAVIGSFAQVPVIQGGGSANVNPASPGPFLGALRQALPSAEISFAVGVRPDGESTETDVAQEIAEAVAVAATAQVAVVLVGSLPGHESEGYDRAHLELPGAQRNLVDAVIATGTPTVVAVAAGSAVLLGDWHDRSAAVLHWWFGGEAAGESLADVLTGSCDARGRLGETIPLRAQDVPAYLSYPGELGEARYGEGVFIGYRWYDAMELEVRYPFGHGLSYTTFEYEDLEVTTTAEGLRVEVSVQNTGARSGTDVLQVYCTAPPSLVRRPIRDLVGFEAVSVEAGVATRIFLDIPWKDLAYYDVAAGGWRCAEGDYRIEVGASSRDLRLSTAVAVPSWPVSASVLTDEGIDTEIRARTRN